MRERFHKTVEDEFYSIAFRRKLYTSLDELQADLDAWLHSFHTERPHSGRYRYGNTPMQAFQGAEPRAQEKELHSQYRTPGVPDNHQRLSDEVQTIA